MSGFFIAPDGAADLVGIGRQLSFTEWTRAETLVAGLVGAAVTRVDPMSLWGPARDGASGRVALLGGRLALEEVDWVAAERLPFEGGLACRWLLDRWAMGGAGDPDRFSGRLNGAFTVVLVDPEAARVHVITDRMGAFPAYRSTGSMPWMVASHPDVLARALGAAGHRPEVDLVTAAEFVGRATSVQPYTLYRGIEQLEPASCYRWTWAAGADSAPRESRSTYWEPAYLRGAVTGGAEELAEELAAAFRAALRRRTLPRLGRTAVLLSGGADSRAALFGSPEPSDISCLTLSDEENPELATARRLAATAGAEHRGLRRPPDYYGENAAEAVRISGGMWSLMDAHYVGYAGEIGAVGTGVVLSGCYADCLFKGWGFNRRFRTLFGRCLPLFDFAPFAPVFYHDHTTLGGSWERRVTERSRMCFPPSEKDRFEAEPLRAEYLRVSPLSREANASGRLCLWRMLPWDPWLCDSEILDVYGRIPAALKLNGEVFGRAVGKVVGVAGRRIPNNNYGTPVDAGEGARVAWFLWGVLGRKVRRLLPLSAGRLAAATGSWPDWSIVVATSPAIARLWEGPDEGERDFFGDLLGFDPWGLGREEWARRDALLFLRLVTLRTWMRQFAFSGSGHEDGR